MVVTLLPDNDWCIESSRLYRHLLNREWYLWNTFKSVEVERVVNGMNEGDAPTGMLQLLLRLLRYGTFCSVIGELQCNRFRVTSSDGHMCCLIIAKVYLQLSFSMSWPTETSSSGPFSMEDNSSSMNSRTLTFWLDETDDVQLRASSESEEY